MMNNMYDILEKMNLLEGKAAKPDFLDIDKDGDRKEPMKQAAKEVDESIDEGDYSAKKARAGRDIGKPGKTFAKIAKSAGERYGSKERGEKVAGAVLAKLRAKEDVNEADVEEGNEFTQARMAAIKAGKPTFRLGDRVYKVTGDTSDEKRMDEGFADFFDKKQMYKKIGASVEGRSDDYVVTFKDGTRKRYQEIDGRRRVTSLEPVDAPEEQDAEGNVVKRGRGRPKGTGRKIGTRGVTDVRARKMAEDYDKDEYDEEGEMAKSQARTIEDAAKELQAILDDDENLPEWVQKKITLAKEYIDSARDYMKANPDDAELDVEVDAEEMIPERELTKPEMKKREEIVKSMKKNKGDFEKRYGERGEEVMYATATKQAKKTAEESKDSDEDKVDETTTAGSVAVSDAAPKAKKGGMQFGKGVYEAAIAESFDRKLNMLTEGMNINMSMDAEGGKSLTVSATDDDAVKLAQLLKLAGMESAASHSETCAECGGMHEGECGEVMEADLANSPEPEYAELGDTRDYDLAGGLNGPKLQSNPNNMGDNPLAMTRLGKHAGPNLNLGDIAEDIEQKLENRLMDLYKRIQ